MANKPKNIVPTSLLVAVLPFVGYLTAYNYEKGYLSFFNIPPILIRLGLEEIIVATSVLVLGLFLLYPFLSIIYPLRNLIGKNPKGRTLKITIILFLFLSPIIFIFNNGSILDKLIIALAIFLLLLLYEFGIPFLFSRKGSLDEKLVESEGVGQIEDFIFSRPQLNTVYIAFLAAMYISLLANMAGINEANKQKDYLLFSDNRDTYVIVRNYADKRIAVKVDDKVNSVKNDIRLISSTEDLDLQLKAIGPLKKEERRSISSSLYNFIRNLFISLLNFFENIFVNIRLAITRK